METPLLTSNVWTPRTLWYQTDDYIVLRIMLTDVEKYFLNVDFDHIRFSTVHDDKPYYLCVYFFGAIIPECTTNKNIGREIYVRIPKAHKFLKWPRLQYHKSKSSQITVDLERVEETKWRLKSTYRPPWDDFEEYKKKNNIMLYPADYSSADDESDDDRDFLIED